MGLSVKAEWVDAHTRSLRNSDPLCFAPSHNSRTGERAPPFSKMAGEILGVFASEHRRAGARLRISTLHMRQETEPALAAAVSELASAGLVQVADSGTIELTARGYDVIQRRVLQARTRVLGRALNE
jgi:hypothetical protein